MILNKGELLSVLPATDDKRLFYIYVENLMTSKKTYS